MGRVGRGLRPGAWSWAARGAPCGPSGARWPVLGQKFSPCLLVWKLTSSPAAGEHAAGFLSSVEAIKQAACHTGTIYFYFVFTCFCSIDSFTCVHSVGVVTVHLHFIVFNYLR